MGAKVFTHDVIANGVFYRAGVPVNMETPEHKETPNKKAASAKKGNTLNEVGEII